jgi:protein O-mannosyl-transferase
MFNDKKFSLCVLGLFIAVLVTYSNHFHNSFHFDDSHSIENNGYLRSLGNIPLFFKSGTTFSTLPSNQTYRPMLSVVYAIAYHLGGGDVFWFHIIIFSFFLVLGFLVFLLSFKVFEVTYPHPDNKYFALFASGWFMLSTCNSDTINYISSSSDSLSTCWVMVALCMFIYFPAKRKFGLYLIPLIIAVLFKPSAIVFPLLLGAYIFLFEYYKAEEPIPEPENNIAEPGSQTVEVIAATEEVPIAPPKPSNYSFSMLGKVLLVLIPSLLLCFALYKLQAKLNSPNWHPSASFYNYIITQPFVTFYYFLTFYFPLKLSVDPDWATLTTMFDWHFVVGIVFLVALVVNMLRNRNSSGYFPISFGLFWFLVALLPSALVPLEEVMNDHRSFFSNIGLVIASTWVIRLFIVRIGSKSSLLKSPMRAALVAILLLNAYGTFERNKVWKSEQSLWYDVTIKSPNNGRGLMNYGNVLMAQGNYNETEIYYRRALQLCPYYSYLYDNMAILKAAENQPDSAEVYFNRAMALSPGESAVYFFYARFLHQQNKDDEAIRNLKQCLAISPSEVDARYLLMNIYQDDEDWQGLADAANKTLALFPGDATAKAYLQSSQLKKSKITEAVEYAKLHPTAGNYIDLSLLYFNHRIYDSCISAAGQALKLDSTNKLAYNNIGSAYNALGDWSKAEVAFNHALKIDPGFSLAINNLAWCRKQENMITHLDSTFAAAKTPDDYLNISLLYYNKGLYQKTIDACKKAIALKPDFALAYNNMCSAYNNLKLWDSAIAAGEKAVLLAPDNKLAKNNLAFAKSSKAADSR